MRLLDLGAILCALCLVLVASLQLESGKAPDIGAGLAQLRALAEAGELEAAQALGESLLTTDQLVAEQLRELELEHPERAAALLGTLGPAIDFLRLAGPLRSERAHVHHALGTLHLVAEAPQLAQAAFRRAQQQAGDGDLRLDAAYDLGTLALLAGEAWRAQIPELGGQPPAPPQPPTQAPGTPPGAGAAPPEEEPPDPLEQARAAYAEALDHYTARLSLDWRDADTRANTELTLRRLRELERIEEEREQQQQQQQEEQDQEQENQEQQDQEQQNQQDQQDQQEQEPQESEPQEPEQQQEEPPQQPEEQEPQDGAEQEAPEAEPQEEFLTKEEVQRLLDRLEQHEEQWEELKERMRAQSRRSTARDW